MSSEKRYLFYADFLGTTKGYTDIRSIRSQRRVLERAAQTLVLPNLEEHDLYVYIASDSLFVCCPRLDHLLQHAARLFRFYFLSAPGQPRLRGAISYGEKSESYEITNTRRVVAIPLLDDSLPRVYNLEKLRKGSRIFLDQNIPKASFHGHESHLLHWKSITGRGDRENARVSEFLWPRLACDGSEELLESAKLITIEWLQRLNETQWDQKDYESGIMIQLDETLKLFIRSLAPFTNDAEVKKYLESLLPQTSNHKGQVIYEWGVWFQAAKALCESGGVLSDQLRNQIAVVKQILVREGHIDDFRIELEELDYVDFKKCVWALFR